MSEALLEALMQLFALLTDVKHTHNTGRAKVEEYLSAQFNSEYVRQFIRRYDFYLSQYQMHSLSDDYTVVERQTSDNLQKMSEICQSINEDNDIDAKTVILSALLSYIYKDNVSFVEETFVDNLADNLRIPAGDYWGLKTFTLQHPLNVVDKERLLLIDGNPSKVHPDVKHIYNSKQRVEVWVLHMQSTNTFFFKYYGERNLYLNGHKMEADKVYALKPGAVLNTSSVRPVYYGHISEKFITRQDTGRIIYRAIDIEYKFNENSTAIHRFSFLGKSGQLVGIMGGSGTGKSTLINVLNGNYKPSHGTITINGYDLLKDKKELQGVIGYVPQDDILNEELTVWENLAFNARLIFSDKSIAEQDELVEKALTDFDLVEARDLKVGTPLNKILSGGQRKRLNIALELMREPSVLFVDDQTSGLKTKDSESVLRLLKRQVLKGKLVIINIHQPSSDLYKLIDKLLVIDQGGRIIYNGNPMNAIVYFKRRAQYVNPEERECYVCGNVKTAQPLHIIEARMVDPYGKLIRKRKTSPEEWYKMYLGEFESSFDWKTKTNIQREKLPANLYSIPSRFSQFKTYAKRDALKKIKDSQYFFINLFEVPILALILSFATKFAGTAGIYTLWANSNLPTYLFMCVVVAIFVGLNVSAEEIIKDRKIQMREQFLNLSRSSYLNSKIMNLLFLAAVQSFLLVLIGNTILEIRGMTLGYWAIIFSVFSHAIILGLNISSGLKTAVSIYISIPLIIVPQLLFSGTMVNFDKLHSHITNRQYVPVLGDVVMSRWAYEALAVYQFKNNDYEEHFFEAEKERSTASYVISSWIPEIQRVSEDCRKLLTQSRDTATLGTMWRLLKRESNLVQRYSDGGYGMLPRQATCTLAHLDDIDAMLAAIKTENLARFERYNHQCDSIGEALVAELGGVEAVVRLKKQSTNEALNNLMLNKFDYTQISVYDDMMVRHKQPIYNAPMSRLGRAHFYAPEKTVGTFTLSTPIFNCIVIWIATGVFYIALYFDLLRKLIVRLERMQKRRLYEKIQKLRI